MKKQLILALVLINSFAVNAQLTNAILALQEDNLKIAKESIDKQMKKEKSLTDPKSWYYKGNVYERINASKDESIRASDTNALAVSVEAYNKAVALDKPKGEWGSQAKDHLEGLWGVSFNKGIEEYNAQQYSNALKYFSTAQSIKPADTLAYTVAASVAIQGKDFAYAKSTYYKLLEMNHKTYNTYKNLLYLIQEGTKKTKQDTLKANEEQLKVVSEARKAFPKDNLFMAQEVNLYIATGKQNEAISKLTEAVSTDPGNAKVYYFNLGILYKQSNNNIKAKENFNKSLEIDSLYEGSNYMVGLMLMEEGDAFNKKANNMTYKEYQVKGKNEEIKRDAMYKKAIPFLEKSYSVNKEQKLKDQLITLYKRFKMEDKIKKIQ